jgi:hypothetical protein
VNAEKEKTMGDYRSQVREVINRNTVVSLALKQGFNAFLPVYDGGIVDFILYRERDNQPQEHPLRSRYQSLPMGLDGEGLSGVLTEQAGSWLYKRNLSPITTRTEQGREVVIAGFAPVERVMQQPSLAALNNGHDGSRWNPPCR